MAITYPYKYQNYIMYEGDIGPGLKEQFSLVLMLVDSVTGEAPIGSLIVSFKEIKKKPFKNLSGAFCFKGLADGPYSLKIESENYFPVEETIIIGANQDVSTQNAVKVITLQLTPKLSYPISSAVALYVYIINSEYEPQKNVDISCKILSPACYFKSEYDGLVGNNENIKGILDNYTSSIDSKICIYPETISEPDQQQLQQLGGVGVYDAIIERSRRTIRGSLRLSYLDYATFLKEKIIKDETLSSYESYPNNMVCLTPDEISDDDRQNIPGDALTELIAMASESLNGKACFAHKKYIEFLKKFYLEDAIFSQYEKDKNGRIYIELDEISTIDLEKMREAHKAHIDSLEKEAEVKARTNNSGECLLIFSGIKSIAEKIRVQVGEEDQMDPIYFDLKENTPNSLRITFP